MSNLLGPVVIIFLFILLVIVDLPCQETSEAKIVLGICVPYEEERSEDNFKVRVRLCFRAPQT